MTFKNILFPIDISYGAVGGPRFNTDVAASLGGKEARNQNWSESRCIWDMSKTCTTDAKRTALIAFFRVMRGRLHSFPVRDWSDYKVSSSEGVLSQLTGNTWQLQKRYSYEGETYDRDITLPVDAVLYSGSPLSQLTEGMDYTLNDETGVATFGSPTVITPSAWSGQFNVRCRFDTDDLKLTIEDLNFFRSQMIPVIEVRATD